MKVSYFFISILLQLFIVSSFSQTTNNGKQAAAGKIVGGSVASDGEYPYMVAISLARHKPYCGGTLISPKVVLTAAHCVDPKYAEINCVDLNDCTVIRVDATVRHPSYRSSNLRYDVMLVFLREAVSSDLVSSFPLVAGNSWSSISSGTDMTIIGWGATVDGGGRSQLLREAEVDLVSKSSCERSYRFTRNDIYDENLCAYRRGRDTCQGDSGGPMMVRCANGNDVIVGISSWGMECGSSYPGVYTKVSAVHSWIEERMKSFDTSLSLPVAAKCNGEIVPQPSPTPYPTPYPTSGSSSSGGGFWCFWGLFC